MRFLPSSVTTSLTRMRRSTFSLRILSVSFGSGKETIIAAMRSTKRLEVQSEERHAPEKRSIVGSVDAFMSEK